MLYCGEKPDYNRKEVKVDIKPILRVREYDTMSILDLTNYLSSVIVGLNNKEINLEFVSTEECQGFDYPKTYIEIYPYYERLETDEEYNKRITEEEEEYKKYQEAERLKAEEYEQYQKDIEEYRRIKKKYKIL